MDERRSRREGLKSPMEGQGDTMMTAINPMTAAAEALPGLTALVRGRTQLQAGMPPVDRSRLPIC